MKKHILTLTIVGVGIGIIGLVVFLPNIFTNISSSTECKSNPHPIFSVYPTDIDDITQIAPPIMQVHSGVKSHSYINVTKPTPIYAPADGTLVTGAKYTESYIDTNQVQYTLFFRATCEVSYYFDHLINPPSRIAAVFPGPPQQDTRSENFSHTLEVKAGDVLGYSWSGQFDFGVLNNAQENAPLRNFPKYKHSEKAYADCPIKYYNDDMRARLLSLLGYKYHSDLNIINNLCD